MLTVAACNNGETAIFKYYIYHKEYLCSPLLHACNNGENMTFSIYHKEARGSPLLQVSKTRLQFSVYIIKKLCAHSCNMYQRWDYDFRNRLEKSSRARSSTMSRLWFLEYVIEKFCARRWNMYQRRHCDFRYILYIHVFVLYSHYGYGISSKSLMDTRLLNQWASYEHSFSFEMSHFMM